MSNFEIDPAVNARVKKNLLWVSIFSIIMIFAGLTSAYLVSRGSVFWVEFKKPVDFIYSTICVLFGSVMLIVVAGLIKKDKKKPIKLLLGLTFLSGILFTGFQYTGWIDLHSRGNALSTPLINSAGKYGLHYSITYQNKEITFDGYDFYFQGEILSPELHDKMKKFCQELADGAKPSNRKHLFNISNYGTEFSLFYQSQLVVFSGDSLSLNGKKLNSEMLDHLHKFSESIVKGRGDFMITGKLGVDFNIWYKGKMLEYVNRTFYLEGNPLKAKEESDLNGAENQAASYTFAFVVMHALHLIGGIIALLVIWIRSIQEKYSADNHLGIQLGSIYWHFLGILWIYLYAFLIFIH